MTSRELKKKWPSIEKKLETGDVILVRKRSGVIPKLIRWKSKSYWNHTALVFKDREVVKFGSLLIIEAYTNGIEIHKLKKYTDYFDDYDIGIKRFPGMDYKQRINTAKNFMLNNIDVKYDYSRLFTYFLTGPIKSDSHDLVKEIQKRAVNKEAFVCSTFVHKAVSQFKKKEREVKGKFEDKELKQLKIEEEITPGNIARDNDFKWIFNKRY